MSIYHSPYSDAKNFEILTSLRSNGIASAAELHEKTIKTHTSSDTKLNQHVYVNAYAYNRLKNDFEDSIGNLFHHFGCGVFQIAYERHVNYLPPGYSTELLVSERIHNCVLFVLNPALILEREPNLKPSFLYGETTLKHSVPLAGIKKAFVPSPLIELFKSIFSSIKYIEVKCVTQKYTVDNNAVSIKSENFTNPTSECQIPDFQEQVIAYVGKHLKKRHQPLFFHLLRLVAPSDKNIEEIKAEAEVFSDLRDLDHFDASSSEEVKVCFKKYQKLKLINEGLKNLEITNELKKFENRRLEIILKSPLCKNGSLTSLNEFSNHIVEYYFKVDEYQNTADQDEKEKIFNEIISIIKTNEEFFTNKISISKNFLEGYGQKEGERNQLISLLKNNQHITFRLILFSIFPKFIKNLENLECFHRELALE